jgi:hypothetical protein
MRMADRPPLRIVFTVEVDRERLEVSFERLTEEIVAGGGELEPQDTLENYSRERAVEAAGVLIDALGWDRGAVTVRLEIDGKEVQLR